MVYNTILPGYGACVVSSTKLIHTLALRRYRSAPCRILFYKSYSWTVFLAMHCPNVLHCTEMNTHHSSCCMLSLMTLILC